MPDTGLTLELDGRPASRDVLSRVEIQLEEATAEADAAVLIARLDHDAAGQWRSPVDALAAPRAKVAVELKRDSGRYRFDGLVAEASWSVAPDGISELTVKAVDRTLELAKEEKVVSWRSSDSSIATSILSSYGLRTEVTSTPDKPDPDVHVVIQRGTDLAFLRSLAAKWGYAFYLESRQAGVTGVFGPLDPSQPEQATLEFGFGGAAARVTVQAGLVASEDVAAARIAPLATTVVKGRDAGRSGAQGAGSLAGQTGVLLSPNDVDGEIDPGEAAKGFARRSAFAVTLLADLDAARVAPLIRARRTVEVTGLGTRLDGIYLVDRVRHRVNTRSHRQQVTFVRNALGVPAGMPATADLAGALA